MVKRINGYGYGFRVGRSRLSVMTYTPPEAETPVYTEGDGLTAPLIRFGGASNVEGNQDGTGVTAINVAAARSANPSNWLNKGAGGTTGTETLAAYEADTPTNRAAYQVFQLWSGNDSNDPGGEFAPNRLTVVNNIAAAMVTNSVPDWVMATSFTTGSGPMSDSWMNKRISFQTINEAYPGLVWNNNFDGSNPEVYPPLTTGAGGDVEDQANDLVPGSYLHDSSHMNAAGYTIQGSRWPWQFGRAWAAAGDLPCLAYTEWYSQESTANTIGGLVKDLVVIGDLTDTTVDLLNYTEHFAAAVQSVGHGTSLVRVTRASNGELPQAYYELKLRFTKGTVRDTYRVRLGIGRLDTSPRKVAFENLGASGSSFNGGLCAGNTQPLVGVTDDTAVSYFLNFRMLPGHSWGTESGRVLNGTDLGLNICSFSGGGNISSFVRNGATTTSVFTHGVIGGSFNVANSEDREFCVFGCFDTVSGVGFNRYEVRPLSTGIVSSNEPTITFNGPSSSPLGLNKLLRFGITGFNDPMPMVKGPTWIAQGFMDWREEANRALVRNASTFDMVDSYDESNDHALTSVAGTGSGNTLVPYIASLGNAADVLLGRFNWGTGENPATGEGRFAVNYADTNIYTYGI